MRTSLAVAMFALTLAGSTLAGPFEDATAAYNRGDYTTAFGIRMEFAEQGDPAAQVLVGLMYARGHGVPRDDAQAVQWYRKAAEQDYAWGQTNLGYMYESGRGVAKDEVEAAKWYLKAAERGFAMAEDNLGRMYRDGRGVARDEAAAVAWFRKAAERGYAEGQNNLGHMYESGRGVAKDDGEAVAWFRKAAAQGSALGQQNLERLAGKARIVAGGANCRMLQIDQWPVRRRRGWLTIDGAINGQSVGILLDTGAMHTLIFRSAAARLGLATRRIVRAWVSGVGGDSNAESADVGEFRIGGVTRKNWTTLVAGEQDPGDGIAAVLGEDFFQSVDVEFDLAHDTVRLFRPGTCTGAGLAYWASDGVHEVEIEAVNATRPRIVVPVRVNGLPIVALFDTGAATSIVNKAIAARVGVRPESPGVAAAGKVAGAGKEMIDVWIGPFESFEIGGAVIQTPSILFGELGNVAQMLLGMDFLRAHRLLVSHSQRRIYFTANGGAVFQQTRASELKPTSVPASEGPPQR